MAECAEGCFKNVLKLIGVCFVGFIFSLGAFPVMFAIPDVCPSEVCTMWFSFMAVLGVPFYLGFVSLFSRVAIIRAL